MREGEETGEKELPAFHACKAGLMRFGGWNTFVAIICHHFASGLGICKYSKPRLGWGRARLQQLP